MCELMFKILNTFHATGLLLCPLKTSEKHLVSWFSVGIERDQMHEVGLSPITTFQQYLM